MASKAQPQKQTHPVKDGFFRADIIITCHNYGRYLEQAINSAIGQGNVIVVDDASTDDTETIAKG
ncbi:MAG: glycosyltransferase, partial [Patescibacteria group bacterium]|nr:glycosyltransferase [Patescibacteria group bacterium]